MLFSFILGFIAAAAAATAEPYVEQMTEGMKLSAMELRLSSFAVCLLIAALVASLIGSGGAVSLTLGAVAGIFVPRVLGRSKGA